MWVIVLSNIDYVYEKFSYLLMFNWFSLRLNFTLNITEVHWIASISCPITEFQTYLFIMKKQKTIRLIWILDITILINQLKFAWLVLIMNIRRPISRHCFKWNWKGQCKIRSVRIYVNNILRYQFFFFLKQNDQIEFYSINNMFTSLKPFSQSVE